MTASLPFADIASFLKSPYIPQPTTGDGEVAVLGVPWDEGTTSRPGARYGPRALRDVSTFWAYRDEGEPYYDGEARAEILGDVRFVDTGDVSLPPTGPADVVQNLISERVRGLAGAGLFPLVLGGDHSITYPVLTGVVAARDGAPVHLVHFDTHMDYWDEESGMRHTHASPIIRSAEDGLQASLTQFGIRGLQTAADNIALERERGAHIFWCEQARKMPADELVAHLEPGADVFVTFDIDCLDPAIAPGTGTPEPGGFSYYEAKAILRAVAARTNVIGMDLVEVSPLYDPSQLTALHGVRLVLDLVGAALTK